MDNSGIIFGQDMDTLSNGHYYRGFIHEMPQEIVIAFVCIDLEGNQLYFTVNN